jgi:hypothetical protein
LVNANRWASNLHVQPNKFEKILDEKKMRFANNLKDYGEDNNLSQLSLV